MQGRRKFIGCFDAIGCLCDGIIKSFNIAGIDYFKDLSDKIGILKLLTIKMSAHDNLIYNLYYDSLIKLPIRIGTLDFYKINKNRPDLDDAVIQAQQVVRQICDSIQVHPFDKRQLTTIIPSRATIQLSSHKCDIYDKGRRLWQVQKQFYRIKFISYTKWRDFKHKYFIQYSLNTNANSFRKIEWLKLREDYVDLPKGVFVNNQYRLLLRFTYFENNLVSKIYLLSMKALRNLQLDPARAIFSLNYRQIYADQQPLYVCNQMNPILDKIVIKSYFIPRNSKYCCNIECTAQKLEYVLLREEYQPCYTCTGECFLSGKTHQSGQNSQFSLIAMRCLKCHKSYCLKCKLKNFIVKKFTNIKQDTYHYECPKTYGQINSQSQVYELGKAPIIYKYLGQPRGAIKNNCLYCEKDIIKGNKGRNSFSGLRICEICILYHIN